MRRWIVRVTAGAALAVAIGGPVVVPVTAHAEVDPDTDQCVDLNTTSDVAEEPAKDPSEPLVDLQVEEAQRIARRLGGKAPGAGVNVAVIDSGVYNADIPTTGAGFQATPDLSSTQDPTFYHGTAMAGIIAGAQQPGIGPIGIAPGAKIVAVRVYDSEVAQEELRAPTEDSVIAGLEAVAPYAGTKPDDIRIVNISLAVKGSTPELLAAVRKVTGEGAIVVASSGNRAGTDEDETPSAYEPGEDAGDTWFPAGYARDDTDPLVVAVGTTTSSEEGDTPVGLLSSAIDVVVPTYGAVSYSNVDSTCVFAESSTSVAAAEVSGILAMMMTAFPRDSAAQLIARLEATATGGRAPSSGAPDKYVGRGIVQPIDALTRPLPPGGAADVAVAESKATPAALPTAEPDVLRGTRRNAVWWGLFGGGALVVAMLLRPVLSRRRRVDQP